MGETLEEAVERLDGAIRNLLAAVEGLHERVTRLEATARVNVQVDPETGLAPE